MANFFSKTSIDIRNFFSIMNGQHTIMKTQNYKVSTVSYSPFHKGDHKCTYRFTDRVGLDEEQIAVRLLRDHDLQHLRIEKVEFE